MTSKRILVSAYGCEPGKGPEQGVGWNWVLQLARHAELLVVTRSNNQEAIEAGIPDDLRKRISFVYYDLPDRLRSFKRRERGLYLYYLLWQWGAYRHMRRQVRQEPVDYVMHLTFGSVWLPTFMHRLPAPFIWGPVGGGEAVPWELIHSLPVKSRFVQYARYMLMATFGFNPLFTGVTRKARVILARTGDTARIFPKQHANKVRVVLETAVSEEWLRHKPHNADSGSNKSLRVIFTGRLVPFKNVGMAIQAVAAAKRRGVDIHFFIVGDGPMQSTLYQLAADEGIVDSVTFLGRCTHEEVLQHLSTSHVYLFPSLREGGPWSLMEAMASGLPSICVNTSGMKVITDEGSARLIEPAEPPQMVEAFAAALSELAASPKLRQSMGASARLRLEQHFRWQQKGEFMATLLDDLERGRL